MLIKRINQIILALIIVLFAIPAWATWTLTPSKVSKSGHYIYWQVLCTSDGSALTATNLLSTTYMDDTLLRDIQGSTMIIMDVVPGTGGVAPNATIDITLANSKVTIYSDTGISNVANTPGKDLSEDYNQYPPILNELNITLNDIGDSGDQITFIFLCWKESL